jgi:hypothetical protein
VFVGEKGTPRGRFQRAIERGNLMGAESAARELGRLSLSDALALLLLIARKDPTRYSRAAARWHARFVFERRVCLEDAELALAALTALRHRHSALEVLAELVERYTVANAGPVLRRFRAASSSSG